MVQDTGERCISGIVLSGAGRGAFFTRVDWVVEQCRRMLGYAPFPGTLNIRVLDSDAKRLDSFLMETDGELVPDDPSFCSAQVKKVTVNGVPGAVVLPAEDVRIHEERVLEILAPVSLRETLGLDDGDRVTVTRLRARQPEGVPGAGPKRVADPLSCGEGRASGDLYRELYEFASSAGALEGYVYPVEERDMGYLNDWVGNLVAQYRALPDEVRRGVQASLDRTLGRAVQSLEPVLGRGHRHVTALRSLIQGPCPESPHDFEQEKKEKAERYGRD
jgi:hypothetical protein